MERNKWGEKMLDFMPNASLRGRLDVRLEIGMIGKVEIYLCGLEKPCNVKLES